MAKAKTVSKYKRSFICDKRISKGIYWLNKNGFYTVGCCSGLKEDHPNQERDILYVEFEGLNQDKISQLKLVARKVGFNIKKRKEILRFDCKRSSEELQFAVFEEFIARLKNKEGLLNIRTMGISNWVLDPKTKKRYSVQFYDYDGAISPKIIKKILEIFPYDCLMYETKHGVHFISFSLLKGLNYTKAKAIKLSKELESQDYWTEAKDLTLRIAPKWKKNFFGNRVEVSKKPKFKGFIKAPDKHIISLKHLEFYRKFMNLPKFVYNLYSDCDRRKYKIKVYHYKTRD